MHIKGQSTVSPGSRVDAADAEIRFASKEDPDIRALPHCATVVRGAGAIVDVALVALLRATKDARPTAPCSSPPSVVFELVPTDGRSGVMEDVTAVIAQVAGCMEAFWCMSELRILLDLLEPGMVDEAGQQRPE
ncbi:hypothetical protein ACP4OV_009961 [Aristida adscensionis]